MITSPADGSVINTSWLSVSGTVNDNEATVIVNGAYATVNNGTFTVDLIALNESSNTITASAFDQAGNTSSDSITVTADILNDPVTITAQPLSGTSPLTVQFTISTNVGGTITNYAWDWEGDSTYDWNSTSTGDTNYTYPEERLYHPTIKISTDTGIDYTATVTITVHPAPVILAEWTVTDPIDLAIDQNRNIYILQRSPAQIKKYDQDGNELTPITFTAYNPGGLTIDNSGRIYLADTGNNQIQRLLSDGTLDSTFGTNGIVGQYGLGEGEFNQPYGIAVDNDGYIYVTDTGNNRVQKFDNTGAFIKEWGTYGTNQGEFNQPQGIAIDGYNYIYIADSANHRGQKFSRSGSHYSSFGALGSNQGKFNQPVDVAIDSNYDSLLIADSGNNRIQLFNRDEGTYRSRIDNLNLNNPSAVVADQDLQAQIIYIADTGNNRVLKVQLPPGGNTPEAVWNAMKQALINEDIEGAMPYYIKDAQSEYKEVFQSAGSLLVDIGNELPPLGTLLRMDSWSAKYEIEFTLNGQLETAEVYFVKDNNGQWKILAY